MDDSIEITLTLHEIRFLIDALEVTRQQTLDNIRNVEKNHPKQMFNLRHRVLEPIYNDATKISNKLKEAIEQCKSN